MPRLALRGAELDFWTGGAGTPLLCLHETATSGEAWRPLAEVLGEGLALIAPDRRGWHRSPAPHDYRATTISEQAGDAAALLAELGELGDPPALVCGAGLGAAVALDLLIGRPELVAGAILIEPPLLAFSQTATEALSADRVALGGAVAEGGPAAAVELCLGGGLEGLAPGTDRLPADLTAPARARPAALFAELGAVPGWAIPLGALALTRSPSRIVVSRGTPALVRDAGRALAGRLADAELRELGGDGPAHLDAPGEIAALAGELR